MPDHIIIDVQDRLYGQGISRETIRLVLEAYHDAKEYDFTLSEPQRRHKQAVQEIRAVERGNV